MVDGGPERLRRIRERTQALQEQLSTEDTRSGRKPPSTPMQRAPPATAPATGRAEGGITLRDRVRARPVPLSIAGGALLLVLVSLFVPVGPTLTFAADETDAGVIDGAERWMVAGAALRIAGAVLLLALTVAALFAGSRVLSLLAASAFVALAVGVVTYLVGAERMVEEVGTGWAWPLGIYLWGGSALCLAVFLMMVRRLLPVGDALGEPPTYASMPPR